MKFAHQCNMLVMYICLQSLSGQQRACSVYFRGKFASGVLDQALSSIMYCSMDFGVPREPNFPEIMIVNVYVCPCVQAHSNHHILSMPPAPPVNKVWVPVFVILESSRNGICLVSKCNPHPVGAFCAHLQPPSCHIKIKKGPLLKGGGGYIFV
jgi:hypothetical protein